MLFGNAFHEGQPKSPSSGSFFLFISSIKRFEEAREFPVPNYGAGIPYFQHTSVLLRFGA
jgi:hypothetical protein